MRKILGVIAKLLGGLLVLLFLVVTVGVLYPLPAPTAVSQGAVLLRNVNLVDVEQGEVRSGLDIHLDAGVIQAVGKGLSIPGAEVLGGEGAFVIPGLFDMHVHSLRLAPTLTHPLFVAAGVTAVRDMGGCLGEYDGWVACAVDKRAWTAAIANGEMVGPRYDQVTGLAINGGEEIPSGLDTALGAADAAGARARVAMDAARGIDFLKPYTMLPAEGYYTLAEEAEKAGLYLAGHKPLAISGLQAVAAGQRSIEHAVLFIWECYPGIDALRQVESIRDAYTHETRTEMIDDHQPERCQELMSAMAAAGTAFVPTHTTRKLDAYALDPEFRSDERLRYIPLPLRTLWLADADGMAARTTEAGYAGYRRFYEFGLEQTGRAQRAGVMVLAGTDAPDSFAFPGFGLHDELEHLVLAGLTPLEALRAATFEPARFLGLSGQAGVVAPGARADLVLLADNPLEDISAVRTVRTVVLAGNVYDRSRLDSLLADVEHAAGHWSTWIKFIWQALRSPIFLAQAKD